VSTFIRVDGSPSSAVYVCRLCGARDVATHRVPILTAAAGHLRVAHHAHPGAADEASDLAYRAGVQAATRRR
jgi:hypothetical protein